MKKSQLTEDRIKFLLGKASAFKFPQFLIELRKAHGLTRRAVCKDLSFSEMRMFWLENGCFKTAMPDEELNMFADYYGIDPKLIQYKHLLYINTESKDQTQYVPKKARKS